MRMDRRRFVTATGAALWTALGGIGANPTAIAAAASAAAGADARRRQQAFQVRLDAAHMARRRADVTQVNNGEETRYPNRIASYSKGLPHNALGEVDPAAYAALLRAVETGRSEDFDKIPLGGGRPLTNPQAGMSFDLEGPDPQHLTMAPAPTIASAEGAADEVELYWMALARDVHFADYGVDPVISAAALELSGLAGYLGPRPAGRVTPDTIFRGGTPDELAGPYLSQFLWLDIPMGAMLIPQAMHTAVPGVDYLTRYEDWLAVQDGVVPSPADLDPMPRYIRNLRDLAEWVRVDALYQAYHQACLILLGLSAPLDPGNPYAAAKNQMGFGTFGGPHILSLVTEVATRALKAVWYQKWFVHRRVRPEAFGGLVHHALRGTARYPVHRDLLESAAVHEVFARHGSYLLPMASPDGCPTHPSYGAGHATVAGACVTILKAWFEESHVFPHPVVPDASGQVLVPYAGPALTVGGELNKLAANVAFGRSALGVHYRSDSFGSLRLGEAVALGILEEHKLTYHESASFSLTTFDGARVTI